MVTSSSEGQTHIEFSLFQPHKTPIFLSLIPTWLSNVWWNLYYTTNCQSQLDFLSHQQPQHPAVTAGFNTTAVGMWQDFTHSTKTEPGVSMSCPQLHSLGHGPNHLHVNLGDCSKLPFLRLTNVSALKNYHLENDITRSMSSWALYLRKDNLKSILWLLVQWVTKTK